MDELLASVAGLKETQETSKLKMGQRLDQLEKDVSAKQDQNTERMVKKLKRDRRGYEFKRKGNKRQFLFNDELKDRIEAASAHLVKLKPTKEQETALKVANEELQEDAKTIHAWQKLIRIADCSELGWQVIEVYESDELASDDKDANALRRPKNVLNRRT